MMPHARSSFPVLSIALLTGLAGRPRTGPSAQSRQPRFPPTISRSILDPQSTQIRFKVVSLLRDVRGTFQFKGGALAIDPDSTLAQGELLVDATTGRTGSAAHDKEFAG